MKRIAFSIYIASQTRIVHLTKSIDLPDTPRVGEWVKFTIRGEADYVPWRVAELTFHESGEIHAITELLDNVDGRGYSFSDEVDFDETLQDYLASGWTSPHGIKVNKLAE